MSIALHKHCKIVWYFPQNANLLNKAHFGIFLQTLLQTGNTVWHENLISLALRFKESWFEFKIYTLSYFFADKKRLFITKSENKMKFGGDRPFKAAGDHFSKWRKRA